LIKVNNVLYSFDLNKKTWTKVILPKDRRSFIPYSFTGIDHRSILVGFSEPGSSAVAFSTYIPAENRWEQTAGKAEYKDRLTKDPAASEFAKRRYGTIAELMEIDAAAALSQWYDLKEYLRRAYPGCEPGTIIDDRGRLVQNSVQKIAARHWKPDADPHLYIKGMTLPIWSREGLNRSSAESACSRIARLGTEWVALIVTGYQNDPLSTHIYHDPEWTASMNTLENAIITAHKNGLKVFIKPHLNLAIEQLDNHMWRGIIKPRSAEETDAWFKGYQEFLMGYVDLAIRHNVEMLAMGVELKGMIVCTAQWENLIKAVRERGYTGLLTYAGHHETFDKGQFWKSLDYIGLDFYLGATKTSKPSFEKIIQGYQNHAARLKAFSSRIGRPMIFTEVGFNNLDGCNKVPWHWSSNSASLDNLEQAVCYHAVLDIFPREEWFGGMFWWCWEPSGAPLPSRPSYSPQSKLAELILEGYYRCREEILPEKKEQ
jgi:hypothetical protein